MLLVKSKFVIWLNAQFKSIKFVLFDTSKIWSWLKEQSKYFKEWFVTTFNESRLLEKQFKYVKKVLSLKSKYVIELKIQFKESKAIKSSTPVKSVILLLLTSKLVTPLILAVNTESLLAIPSPIPLASK